MASEKFIPYARQYVDDEDIAAVTKVLGSDYLSTGPAVTAFEEALAKKVAARHAVACSSGTAGLHLAMLALGIGPGDAVVVPSITFLATANVVRHVGAEVAFADVDQATGLMEAVDVEAALERAGKKKVKAVIPVHMGGQCADMAAIARVAEINGLHVIEDACHAIGSLQYGKAVGGCEHSRMAVFSGQPLKTIVMGEGGAVTTNDRDISDRMARLRNHGMVRERELFADKELSLDANGEANPWAYEMHEPGFNYRASDLQCALGLSQLEKLDRFVSRRRKLADLYDTLLAPLAPVVRAVARAPECEAAWHLYQVLVDFDRIGIARSEMMRQMREEGIGTQVHYIPVHRQPYYRQRYGETSFLSGAEAFYENCLTIPLFFGLEESEVDRVVRSLSLVTGRS